MRWLILALAAIPVAAAWATLVFVATAHGWLRDALAPPGDTQAFLTAAAGRLEAQRPGGAALRLLSGGEVAGEHFTSRGARVGAATLFPVASLSKWVTAWAVLDLVEAGAIGLDAPVEDYLQRWRLPDSEFDHAEVTVRRLLSHTAGLTDDLGHAGFPPGVPVQPLVPSLDQAADPMTGVDGRTRVGIEPGSAWRYSGGGYALLQLMIEDVTSRRFAPYLRDTVLAPLGLQDSTFEVDPEASDVVTSYHVDGTPAPHLAYSAPAAAGLFSSAADLTRFVRAHLPGVDAEPGGGVLEPSSVQRLFEPQASIRGTDVWGLGVMLFAPNGSGGYIAGHDGNNEPAVNVSVRFDPASGDGIIALVSGDPMLATELGREWVFWQTGTLDAFAYARARGAANRIVGAGWVAIAVGVLVIGWRVGRSRRT